MQKLTLPKEEEIGFIKNHRGRYEFMSEVVAPSAGLESPLSIIGKTDLNACWGGQAHVCAKTDADARRDGLFHEEELLLTADPEPGYRVIKGPCCINNPHPK